MYRFPSVAHTRSTRGRWYQHGKHYVNEETKLDQSQSNVFACLWVRCMLCTKSKREQRFKCLVDEVSDTRWVADAMSRNNKDVSRWSHYSNHEGMVVVGSGGTDDGVRCPTHRCK